MFSSSTEVQYVCAFMTMLEKQILPGAVEIFQRLSSNKNIIQYILKSFKIWNNSKKMYGIFCPN